MIDCVTCQVIINEYIQAESSILFDRSVTHPTDGNGAINTCSECGRTWVLVVTTLMYEGDPIPANAVLVDENDYPALTELEAREAMEGL